MTRGLDLSLARRVPGPRTGTSGVQPVQSRAAGLNQGCGQLRLTYQGDGGALFRDTPAWHFRAVP